MAECTASARCTQERRFFRKEFHRWGRNMLHIIGLERIAEELMGPSRWHRIIKPIELDAITPVDWSPDEFCCFCKAKKLPPFDPASGIIHPFDHCSKNDDDVSVSSDQGIASCRKQFQSPFSTDQPLDLSVNSMRHFGDPSDENSHALHSGSEDGSDSGVSASHSFLKVPHIPLKSGQKRRVDSNGKKSYTEEELQAALRDIQSGKLGTRRAAVIYGIPRSTLRNKVYKLAMEKNKGLKKINNNTKNNSHLSVKGKAINASISSVVKHGLRGVTEKSNGNSVISASESLRQLLKHTITQKTLALDGVKAGDLHSSRALFCNSEALAAIHVLNTLEYSQALAPVLSQMLSNIQHLALSKDTPEQSSLAELNKDGEFKFPMLPDLIRRLAEERLEAERDRQRDIISAYETGLPGVGCPPDINPCTSAAALSNVILKIPSYKPAKSPSVNSGSSDPAAESSSSSQHRGITVSLKELIARSINQRIGSGPVKREELQDESAILIKQNEATEKNNCATEMLKFPPPHSGSLSKSLDRYAKSEKRTRAKRGRYRNYNRDNLAQAVRAVQCGEMSVHRAGTYFGVPHSTLEYKVKERHLLRPKKRDNISSVGCGTSDSKSSTSSLSCLSKLLKKGSQKANSLEPNNGLAEESNRSESSPALMPSHLSSMWQNMPFFPLELAQENFFASQMMKKLQENVRIHEEARKHEHGQEEMGILETLIKSTLEKSISVHENQTLPPLEKITVKREPEDDV